MPMLQPPRRVWPNSAASPAWAALRRAFATVMVGLMLMLVAPPAEAVAKRAKTQVKGKVKAKAKSKGKARARTKVAPLPVANGKVAVFAFRGESAAPVNQQVVRVLKAMGMDVTTTLRPVDSAEQYRDMAATLGLAVYVHGHVTDNGDRAKATVQIRSGYTGRRIASARFSGESETLPADVGKTLWEQVGPALGRACADASRPRKQNRPMRIEAGTPIETTPRPPETEEGAQSERRSEVRGASQSGVVEGT